MSELRDLAAATICVGFDGATAAAAPLGEMRALGLRGVVLFARNVGDRDELVALIAALHDALGDDLPPIIGIDQEGGRVARVQPGAMPSMMAVGATGDAGLAFRAGRHIGTVLRRIGINVDFAPVLDLALEPVNTVIGARAFGSDPQLVARLGLEVVRGLLFAGVVPVVKHFPGHGSTAVDSHLDVPTIDAAAETLRSRDLVPFEAALRAGVPAMMSAHVVMRAFDADAPATVSRPILTGLLREAWGYDGVVFTDCLEMNAIAGGIGTACAAVAALAAGADCVLISHRLDRARAAIEAIEAAVHDGTLARERLEEAVGRLRRLRTAFRAPVLDRDDDEGVALEIARAAVTIVRGDSVLRHDAVTVVSFEGTTTEGVQGRHTDHASLSAALRLRRAKSEIMRVALNPSDDDIALLEMVLRSLSAREIVIVMRRAHLHAPQAEAIRRILAIAPDAILISAREPYDVPLFPQATRIACTYGDERISFEGLADVMTGRAPAAGSLPVDLAPKAPAR